MSESLVKIRDLCKSFATPQGLVHALKDVSFDIPRHSITGLVGESGSGKTTLGRTLLRLIEPTSGDISFDGIALNGLDARAMRAMRRRMQIIFQDPVSSLNPRLKVSAIIGEGLRAHGIDNRQARVARLLEEVGLQPDHMHRFPHEFSGGQRQRIGIARALAVEPEFIVADESVSALDVSIQAQVLNLLLDLREKHNFTLLFIAHDLSVVEYLCDQIVVMYLGRAVEIASAQDLYRRPSHPYTQALLSAVPIPDPQKKAQRTLLRGDIPSPLSPPRGCVFHTRCPLADQACEAAFPPAIRVGEHHITHCLKVTGAHAR
ncbi:MAG: ABC transporter ATP-binding protein [Pseudomonadota bacterium]